MSDFDYDGFFGEILKNDTRLEEQMKSPFLTRALMLSFVKEVLSAAIKLRPKGTILKVEDSRISDEVKVSLNDRYVTVTRLPGEDYLQVQYTGIPDSLRPEKKWEHRIVPATDQTRMQMQARGILQDILKAVAKSA